MTELFSCLKCGAKFAKLLKLKCNVCNLYTCPSCTQCYCNYNKKEKKQDKNHSEFRNESISKERIAPLFVTIEYAKFLVTRSNLQLKGYIEFIGQRHVVTKDNRKFLISDFLFSDKNDHIPLKIFGPVPQNLFKYRFAINRVLLKKVKVRLFKGEFELILESEGEIILLKEKSNQSLLKFLNSKESAISASKVEV